MKITKEYIDNNIDIIQIRSAKYIEDFAIRIHFSDGMSRLVDFKPFLEFDFSSWGPVRRKIIKISLSQFKYLFIKIKR